MKPEFSVAPLLRIGIWLVVFLVVVQFVVTAISLLMSDWRTYVVIMLVSVVCHLLVERRDIAHQSGRLERMPHDPAPHHRHDGLGAD